MRPPEARYSTAYKSARLRFATSGVDFPPAAGHTRTNAQDELNKNGLHWGTLDEDISVAGLLAGQPDLSRRQLHQLVTRLGLRRLKAQYSCPVAKIAAITLDWLDQTDHAVAPCSLNAVGCIAAFRAINFSFGGGWQKAGHEESSEDSCDMSPQAAEFFSE